MSAKHDERSPDTYSLGSVSHNWTVIGMVEEMNGHGAEVVSGYPLTRMELLTLACHWYETTLDVWLQSSLLGKRGNWDWRLLLHARRKLARITAFLGEEGVASVIRDVEAKARESLAAEDWRIFTTGTEEVWRSVSEGILRELDEGAGTPEG